MLHADIFVGAVAIVLGLTSLVAAIFNWESLYQLRKARWIESICGRNGARIFFVVLGLLLILLGSAVALGYSPNRSQSTGKRNDTLRRSNILALTIMPVSLPAGT